jgi:hypothetical protein
MYQGPTSTTTTASETGGNLERIYETLSSPQSTLLRDILIELRVMTQVLQAGLNTSDDPENLRQGERSDNTLSVILDS